MCVSQFRRLFSQGNPLDPAEAEDQWALWRHAGGSRIAHRLISYINERVAHAQRWHHPLSDWPGDLRFAWGMRDPGRDPPCADGSARASTAAPVTELADLGHYPQIEQPGRFAGEIAALASAVSRRSPRRTGRSVSELREAAPGASAPEPPSRHVLVWYAETAQGRAALQHAQSLAVAAGARLTVLAVVARERTDIGCGLPGDARARRPAAPPGWRLRVGDVRALDQPDASFDVLIASYLLQLLAPVELPAALGDS